MTTPVESPDPAHGAAAPAAAVQAPDPRDYLARIRSDPEFAETEIKKHQSAATQARNELKSLAPIKDVVSRLDGGAATAAQLIYEQAAILQHPEVRAIVEHYRKTGTLPTSPTSRPNASEDEYQDPVEVLRNELTALREQVAAVQGHVQRDRTLIAHTATQSHLQKIGETYNDIWDIIQPTLLEQVDTWEKSPQGREVLSGATFETWDNLAKFAIGKHADEVLTRRADRRVQAQADLGTEPRPRTVTSGREPEILREERFRPGTARKLIESIHRREGRLV